MSSGLLPISLATPKTMDSGLISVILNILFFTPSHLTCRLNLCLNGIGSVTIHLSNPENYDFDANIGRFQLYLHVTPFPSLGVLEVLSPIFFADTKSYYVYQVWMKLLQVFQRYAGKCINTHIHFSIGRYIDYLFVSFFIFR